MQGGCRIWCMVFFCSRLIRDKNVNKWSMYHCRTDVEIMIKSYLLFSLNFVFNMHIVTFALWKKKWFQLFVYVNFTLVNLYSIIETHWWFRILLASVVYIIIKLFRFWEQRLLCWLENWYKATQSGVITLILKLTFCIVLFLYKYTNNHGIELLVFWNDA